MALEKWKKLSETVIFEHPRLVLVEDTVQLPNGTTTQYLRYQKGGDAVSIVAINEQGLILISREYSHPPNEILYQLPGGCVPNGEAVDAGANRELMEECNLRGDLELLGSYLIDNRRSEAQMHVFVATNLVEESRPQDAEEFIENGWFSETEVDAMIAGGQIKNVHLLAAWTLYKNWRAKNSAQNR